VLVEYYLHPRQYDQLFVIGLEMKDIEVRVILWSPVDIIAHPFEFCFLDFVSICLNGLTNAANQHPVPPFCHSIQNIAFR